MNGTSTALDVRNDMDIQTLGQVLVKSGYFSDTREQAQAIVKVLYGSELGFGPIQSMLGVHIISNKPVLSAGLMGTLIKRSGRYNYRVRRLDNDACDLEFLERVDGKWESAGMSTFTMADAESAGVKGNPTWRKFARNMLFARALSNGARWYCADVFGGAVYSAEEMGADVDGEGNIVSVTPANPTHQPAPQPHASTLSGANPATVAGVVDGEIVNEDTGEILVRVEPKPAPMGKRDKAWSRYDVVLADARALGLVPEELPIDATYDEIVAAGVALKAQVDEIKAAQPAE